MVDFWTWLGTFFTYERIAVGIGTLLLLFFALIFFNKYWKNKEVSKGEIPPLMPK